MQGVWRFACLLDIVKRRYIQIIKKALFFLLCCRICSKSGAIMGGLTACSWIYLEKLVFSADIYVLGLHSPGQFRVLSCLMNIGNERDQVS